MIWDTVLANDAMLVHSVGHGIDICQEKAPTEAGASNGKKSRLACASLLACAFLLAHPAGHRLDLCQSGTEKAPPERGLEFGVDYENVAINRP